MNNCLTMVGYVGQKPEVRNFATGNKLVKFSIGVKEFSSTDEEQKTLWIDVEAWNGMGDRIAAAVTKGREIAVTGRLGLNSYLKDGDDGQQVEVTKPILKLSGFHLCGRKPKKETK